MDSSVLEELGLSNAEARIYLVLLERGQSKTGRIIDSTRLQSSTVYHVLGSLVEKGLASYILKGKVKFYQAENPEAFRLFLDEKKEKLEEIMPLLREKEAASQQKQSARIFEGFNGLKVAFNDILNSLQAGESYCFFQFPKEKLFDEKVMFFFRNYHLKRAEKGIRVRGLALFDSKKIINKLFRGIKHTRIGYIDSFTPNGIVVYKNKLITMDWEDPRMPTAFVIESKVVADSYKRFFDEKWKQAKK